MPTKYQTEEKRSQPLKNTFENTASLDKFREQLTKKNVTSLLILSVIIVTLFATPTAALAKHNERDGGSPSQAANATSTPPSTTHPWLSIHMLDKTHGWALWQQFVLKTTDGGLHWQNVIPASAFSDVPPSSTPRGTFLNDQDAWVVIPVVIPPDTTQDTIRVLRTTDGGKNWQNSIIHTPAGSRSDIPHFLNPSNGWLQTFGQPGDSNSALFHTTDGGLHWSEPGKLNLSYIPDPSGSSFSDTQTGWETGDNPPAAMNNATNNAQPLLNVTHNGGVTWQSQLLPALPGGGKSDMLSTSPPIFFGKTGLLPVTDQIIPPKTPGIGLDLYVTHNSGQTWTPTKFITSTITPNGSNFPTVDAVDSQHAWATLGANLYATSDGGQSWIQLPQPPQPIDKFSFIDTNNGWASTPTNLLHTPNGGRTWQPINYIFNPKPIGTLTNSEQPTTTPPTGKQPTSATPIGSSEKACGFLLYKQAAGNTGPTLLPDTGDQPHVTCFLQAFQQCVSASISFSVQGSNPPTTTDNDFSTQPQSGKCAISKSVTANMEPQPKDAETCAQVKQTGTNVSFLGCTKSGTITFPLAAPK